MMKMLRIRTKPLVIGIAVLVVLAFGYYWINTQPIWTTSTNFSEHVLHQLPAANQNIINYIEEYGDEIAPSYEEKVCTEFVIDVIEHFNNLSHAEKNDINIITDQNLAELIESSSPLIRGVQVALTKEHKGLPIENSDEVLPGDFVQFWNLYNGKAYGHCGVVMDINPGKTLTLYSSHPITNGYGKQTWLWPRHLYFVRLL